jgi:ATP-dependent Clp protease ATP-binding subunit ClpA
MGVTTQAVQKRFVPKAGAESPADPEAGFSRFTARARNVVVASQEAARTGGHDAITPAHLLLGLLTEPDGVSGIVLVESGTTLAALGDAANAALPPPAEAELPALIPFDADTRKVLELTFREALRLGHNYVGTEHVLLALLEQEDGSGPLSDAGVRKPDVEQRITSILTSLAPQPPEGPART